MPLPPGVDTPALPTARPGDAPGLTASTMDAAGRADACNEAKRARDASAAGGRRSSAEPSAALASTSRLAQARLLQRQGLLDAAYALLVDQLCDPSDRDPVAVLETLAENRERAGDLERAVWFEERVVEARRGGTPNERAFAAAALAKVAGLYAD
ncbi:MAG TPA: hypothetical protein VKG23_08450, partial [Thermoanaerobaculia bacterium]|nr:hypothetical protein [Thermoanaerobaculia bacterium]